MLMKTLFVVSALLLLLPSCKNENVKVSCGPEMGSLILVGGHLSAPCIYEKFIELAGGEEENVVLVITAASDEEINSEFIKKTEERFKKHGIKNIHVLHNRSKDTANLPAFFEPVLKAKAVWFTGGRQWRLMDAYWGTKTYDAFLDVLNRGGVIGGSSAGASIQASTLVRGDTKTNTIMLGDHPTGFGFLKNVAVDQHLLAMNRQFDLFEVLQKQPDVLGIGLDENTAIVVQNHQFEVIGEHYVAIYDGSFFSEIRDKNNWEIKRFEQKKLNPNERLFYLLKPGQRYDLKKRQVIP